MCSIRIVLVDDHEVARRALRSVLKSNPNLEVVGEAAEGKEALKKVEEFAQTLSCWISACRT